jgi:hypothetical protein
MYISKLDDTMSHEWNACDWSMGWAHMGTQLLVSSNPSIAGDLIGRTISGLGGARMVTSVRVIFLR